MRRGIRSGIERGGKQSDGEHGSNLAEQEAEGRRDDLADGQVVHANSAAIPSAGGTRARYAKAEAAEVNPIVNRIKMPLSTAGNGEFSADVRRAFHAESSSAVTPGCVGGKKLTPIAASNMK